MCSLEWVVQYFKIEKWTNKKSKVTFICEIVWGIICSNYFFLQFRPSSYWDLGFKIPKPRGKPKKKSSKNVGLLYSKWPHRTHKVKKKKNSSTLDCNRAEKFTKNCQNQAVWFGWGILQCFLQISQPDCNLESWSFFCSLRVFCGGHFKYNKPIVFDI